MADFEAPSFSLGLDFDLLDSEPQITNSNNIHQSDPQAEKLIENDYNDDDFETLTVVDSESECQVTLPKLKRLRRCAAVEDTVATGLVKSKADLVSGPVVVDDDDIEDFSSPEDNQTVGHLSTQQYSVFNSSKVPLSSSRSVLTKETGKRKQPASNDPESVLTNCNKQPFPKLTVSPLRKFQLIDSDSDYDDPSIIEASTSKTSNREFEPYSKQGKPNYVGLSEKQKSGESSNTSTKKDLWDDFPVEKSFNIPTPAFDAVCDEYFSSKKEMKKPQSNTIKGNLNSHIPTPAFDSVCEEYFSYKKEIKKPQSNITKSNLNSHVTDDIIDLDDPHPPAHQYFFHNDPRIQALVRTRLPNFSPLNAENRDSEQPSTSNIDYMGQFSHGDSVKQAARTKTTKAETSSRKTTRKPVTQAVSKGPTIKKLIQRNGSQKMQEKGEFKQMAKVWLAVVVLVKGIGSQAMGEEFMCVKTGKSILVKRLMFSTKRKVQEDLRKVRKRKLSQRRNECLSTLRAFGFTKRQLKYEHIDKKKGNPFKASI